jgi:hypothetical protein
MPNENLHKIVGFIAGLATSWLLRHYNLVVDPEWLAAILFGIATFVSAIIAKYTNPTGAETKEARRALEAVTVEHTREMRSPEYSTKRTPDHDRL